MNSPQKLLATLLIGALVPLAAVSRLQAQTNINWTSNATGNYTWSDTGNWAGGAVPDTASESATISSATYPLPGGSTANISVSSPLTVAGITVGTGGNSTTDSIILSGSDITLTNSVGTSKALISRASASPNLVINNNIVLSDVNGVTFDASNNTSNSTFWLKGVISGSSDLTISGHRAIYFGGANTFSGNVALDATLAATTANAYSGASAGTWTLASGSQTIGTIAAGTTVFANAIDFANKASGNTMNFCSGGTGSTIDFTTNSLTNASGTGNIYIGSIGANTYMGWAPAGTGTVKFSGTGFTIGMTVAGGNRVSILELSPASGTQTWLGNLTGFQNQASVIKSGAGAVILGGNNTYQSQTLVSAGTLILNGTNIQAAMGGTAGFGSATTGRYQVESGAVLGGTGRINVALPSASDSNNMVLVKSGGLLAPGAAGSSIGTFTVDGANFIRTGGNDIVLNMASGAKFNFDIAGNGASFDQVAFWNYVNGDLLLAGGSIAVNLTLSGVGDNLQHTVSLFKFYSDSGVTPFALTNIGSGLAFGTVDPNITNTSFAYHNGSIDLTYTAVPEPATWALLAFSLTTVMVLRRRRTVFKILSPNPRF